MPQKCLHRFGFAAQQLLAPQCSLHQAAPAIPSITGFGFAAQQLFTHLAATNPRKRVLIKRHD